MTYAAKIELSPREKLARHYAKTSERLGTTPQRVPVVRLAHRAPMELKVPAAAPPKTVEQVLAGERNAWAAVDRAKTIMRVVAAYYSMTPAEIIIQDRHTAHIRPRQVAAFLASKYTRLSLPQIGVRLARDHTSILHSVRRIAWQVFVHPEIREDVEFLDARLRRFWDEASA